MVATSDSRQFQQLVERHPTHIRILAEGDSWLDYPRRFVLFGPDANIVDQLADKPGLLIYNTAANGDELTSMLSGEQKHGLIKRLKHNHFDFLLFSGGGNDIVGRNDFDFFLRPYETGMTWQDCIRTERLQQKLNLVENSYRLLCELVQEYSANPDIQIVTHTYDIRRPSPQGYELFDILPLGRSWMYPYLMEKGIKKPPYQEAIAKHLLAEFRETLYRVRTRYSERFHVVDTQGMVGEGQWRDEIHPDSAGFQKVADAIFAKAVEPLWLTRKAQARAERPV